MKLAAKLSLALLLGIVAVMAAYAYVQVSQEVVLHDADLSRARRNALAWLAAIESVWQREGEARARELIRISARRARVAGATLSVVSLDPGAPDRPDLSPADWKTLGEGGIVRHIVKTADGADVLHAYAGIRTADRLIGLHTVEPLAAEQVYIRTNHYGIAAATLAIILICAAIVTILGVRFVGVPLRALRDQARRMGAGDFSGRLELKQHDEVGELASEMNVLCERLDEAQRRVSEETEARITALEQLRHSDRLVTVGQMAAGIAHELGTPLSVVGARAALVAADTTATSETQGHGGVIGDQAARMAAIIRQLLDFARRRGAQPGVTDVQRIVAHTLELLSSVARRRGVALEFTPNPAPVLGWVDEGQMQQALTNVVLNGIQASRQGGRLRVQVGLQRARPPADPGAPEGEYVCLAVQDDGAGIEPNHLPHIFEPFFTTKGVGEGTGLGLSVTHGIVAEHGGWMDVESTLGEGTRFRIFLPTLAPEPARAAS
jgi:signal transduction histidine kinase